MQPGEYSASSLNTMQRMTLMRRAREALQRNPKNVDALTTLASLHAADGALLEALDCLVRALALRKKDPDILNRLVSCASDAKLHAKAKMYARKLCDVQPRNPDNWVKYGQILQSSGNPQQAIKAFEMVHRLDPADPDCLENIGRCHANMGDHDEAARWYEKALEKDPNHTMALYGLGNDRKFQPELVDPYLERLLPAIEAEADKAARAILCYSAGKVLDDTRRHDEAFPWYRQANDLRLPAEPKDFRHTFDNLVGSVTREFLSSRKDWGVATSQPVFIFGMPRSGTTLTESICAAHSSVTAADELEYMTVLWQSFGRDSDQAGGFRASLERMTQKEVHGVGEAYLNLSKQVSGETPHFTDKMPHNFINAGLIRLAFPNARLIHVRRHPLDNCLSLYFNSMRAYHNDYKTDLTRLGLYYRQYLRLMEHWRAVMPGQMLEICYEDLVANTELNARAIISHLGLQWEDTVMDRNRSQGSVKTLSGWQVRQPVYQSSKGKWRNYEKHLGPLIDALGSHVEAYERELEQMSASNSDAARAGAAQ
ncbi:MAG: sulfotransferase [Rhizobiaceae bacterium]